jgi:hypothetical protein
MCKETKVQEKIGGAVVLCFHINVKAKRRKQERVADLVDKKREKYLGGKTVIKRMDGWNNQPCVKRRTVFCGQTVFQVFDLSLFIFIWGGGYLTVATLPLFSVCKILTIK